MKLFLSALQILFDTKIESQIFAVLDAAQPLFVSICFDIWLRCKPLHIQNCKNGMCNVYTPIDSN